MDVAYFAAILLITDDFLSFKFKIVVNGCLYLKHDMLSVFFVVYCKANTMDGYLCVRGLATWDLHQIVDPIRRKSLPKEDYDQSSVHSMPLLYANASSYWNSKEQRISESLSNFPLHLGDKGRQLCVQLQDQDSSPSHSTTPSNHDLAAAGQTNSQERCISSESGLEGSRDRSFEHQGKPIILAGHRDASFNPQQIDYIPPMACISYPCADPYFNKLLAAYGPPPMIQPQIVGMAPARIPLPLGNVAEDEPIYVNAKQYHGILRRRQSRAKLEAQNKLIKVRKPYLHESRHLHAMNRVRGSGGRFLSTKKLKKSALEPISGGHIPPDLGFQHHYSQSTTTGSLANSSSGSSVFQQRDHGFKAVSAACLGGLKELGSGGFMNNLPGNHRHCSPVVR
ncbi:hypothetical protein Nepgr_025184 [Nepenthes gracilis]|uniref:Nuclear transcription factor Y subunit n=1 Tax=Nepenthes gracilis TaxID=150966 RepID=A0AAD3Y187_NEPGR|nr:hypothetical protein Nepgr_025184 [Nepenthes gracilis]